jgi:hypothetical protein
MGRSMKKIAFFVEGQTEQIFVDKLVRHIFGQDNIGVEVLRFSGKESARRIRTIRVADKNSNVQYLFRIYDCHGGGENSVVKSDILEQFQHLKDETFSHIIGIRDVYPLLNIIKLRTLLNKSLPTVPKMTINIFLAVMEIEAWFIAEENHYKKISRKLSFETANKIAGIDVRADSTESIPHPSETLKKIYQEARTTYNKSEEKVQRTVNALDYKNLCANVRNRNNSLNEFLTCLDALIP